jgi:hypothetical protein
MKLQQGQIWNDGAVYFQVVHLERLEVKYKSFQNLASRKGTHHHVSKKEFCRLVKHAILLTPAEVQQARAQTDTPPPQALS